MHRILQKFLLHPPFQGRRNDDLRAAPSPGSPMPFPHRHHPQRPPHPPQWLCSVVPASIAMSPEEKPGKGNDRPCRQTPSVEGQLSTPPLWTLFLETLLAWHRHFCAPRALLWLAYWLMLLRWPSIAFIGRTSVLTIVALLLVYAILCLVSSEGMPSESALCPLAQG